MSSNKTSMEKWLLPPAIDDLLPPYAQEFSVLQQQIMQVIQGYGYQVVYPPLVEYAESLNLSKSADLDAVMARFADYPTGGELGLRADFTPQAARIDARLMDHLPCNRLGYCGETFRLGNKKDDNNSGQGRSTFHIGAELFGDASISSDMEIIEVALECLSKVKLSQPILFLSHATFARLVLQKIGLTADIEQEYLRLLASKSQDYIKLLLESVPTDKLNRKNKQILTTMPLLYGNKSIISEANKLISHLKDASLTKILKEMKQVVAKFADRATIYIDLGEMPGSGYSYHNGLVFGLYVQDQPQCFAEGGRYDFIGSQYSKNANGRPATGFSLDAKRLFNYVYATSINNKGDKNQPQSKTIYAPYGVTDESLTDAITKLRKQGKPVIRGLSPKHNAKYLNCGYELVQQGGKGGKWQLKKLLSS